MALVFMETFDHFNSVVLMALKGWQSIPASPTFQAGRFAGNSFRLQANAAGPQMPLASAYGTFVFGAALKLPSASLPNGVILRLLDAANTTNIARISLNSSTGKLSVLNSAGTTIATGTAVLTTGVWYYIELKIFINGASGTCELHIDGATDIASTAGNFGSTNIGRFALELVSSNATEWDDIYCDDASFLGPQRGDLLVPTGAGASTQWTPSTGSNWQNVDDNPPNGDTDYNSDSTVGHIDSYAVGAALPSGIPVTGVQVNLYARKDDAGLREIASLIRQGGANYVGDTKTLNVSYRFHSQLYPLDPLGSAWTSSTVNADEFGAKVVS